MAALTKVSPTLAGTATTPASAAAGGDSVANPRGNTILRVTNGSGGSINVTLAAQVTARAADGTFPAMTLSNNVVAVAAGATKLIGPIPPAFNDGNGAVQITYSAVTSLTIEAIDPAL